MQQTITVKQLNLYVRSLIEGDKHLSFVSVAGEISNFKNHYSSGHLYFSLKDSDALIRCVMFKSSALRLKCELYDGMAVICKGRVSLYEKDGQYQFYVEEIIPAGEGELAVKFQQIKERLEKEGLFSSERKRPIPAFPKTVAVVTSETGAALQDILNIISRRFPLCSVLLCPCLVQGADAPASIISALERLYNLNTADVIIVGRGGGSIEDLWAFNDEALARVIYNSPIPIISAVGHETDFTICDFVADLRAPTPSAAAEIAVPDMGEILFRIGGLSSRMTSILRARTQYFENRLKILESSRFLNNPALITEEREQALDRLNERLLSVINSKVEYFNNLLAINTAKLESISPLKLLANGYSVVTKDGKVLSSINGLECGQNICVTLSDGELSCRITDIKE